MVNSEWSMVNRQWASLGSCPHELTARVCLLIT